jgi:hypothetical protein
VDGFPNNLGGEGNVRLDLVQAMPRENILAAFLAAELEVPGVAGVKYQVQSTRNFFDWENVGGVIHGQGQPTRVLDSLQGRDPRFYRYVVIP